MSVVSMQDASHLLQMLSKTLELTHLFQLETLPSRDPGEGQFWSAFGRVFGRFLASLTETDQKLTKDGPEVDLLARCSVGLCCLRGATICG